MNNAQVIQVIKGRMGPVRGMTTYNNMLYVVYNAQSHVDVYKLSDFTKSHQIKVDGMKYPDSLVSCEYYKCLYISDLENCIIHRIQLNDNNKISTWSIRGLSTGSFQFLKISFMIKLL